VKPAADHPWSTV